MSLASLFKRPTGKSPAETKYYRSADGRWMFQFAFAPESDEIAVYCLAHPPLGDRDPDPHKTHLFSSGKLCFVEGRGPRDQDRAEELARQWAEYFLEYRRTGVAQS
jgi:hypothetical protein